MKIGYAEHRNSPTVTRVSLADVVELTPRLQTEKARCPMLMMVQPDREDVYSARTGLAVLDFDGVAERVAVLWDAFVSNPSTAFIQISASGGLHVACRVPETGAFATDWELAATWGYVVSGGCEADSAFKSPKQGLYLSSSKVLINEASVELKQGMWRPIADKLAGLDADSDIDVLVAAAVYKGLEDTLGGPKVAQAALRAFASGSNLRQTCFQSPGV